MCCYKYVCVYIGQIKRFSHFTFTCIVLSLCFLYLVLVYDCFFCRHHFMTISIFSTVSYHITYVFQIMILLFL